MNPARLPALLVIAGCCAVAAPRAIAQGTPDPAAEPQADKTLRDPDFGVRTRQFGLLRAVEMYQWQAAEGGYTRDWSTEAVDSSAFAPELRNPPFPLQSRRWLADKVTVDGKPLDPEVLQQLGEWREFRPAFSALPGNLAATFQPEGDGLGSAENPLAPEVGDLRIHWRELALPPLQDRIEMRNGAWHLRAGAVAAAAAEEPAADRRSRVGVAVVAGLALLVLLALVIRRKRR